MPVISFTGHLVDRQVDRGAAARRLKRVSLELGGKNGVVVLRDADLDLATDGILWSAFGTTGQRCTACSRVIVERPVVEPLLERLEARARKLRLGSGLDETVDVGPLINAGARSTRSASYIDIGRARGRARLGGARATDGDLAHGNFFEPTIFSRRRADGPNRPGGDLRAGPVGHPGRRLRARRCWRSTRPAMGCRRASSRSDVNTAFRAMRDFETGIVYVNAGTTGAETHLPFGGWKETGNGHREAGHVALDTFTEWKSIYVDFSGRLQRAQIDNQPS